MNNYTTARRPLRLSETVEVLIACIEGKIRRVGYGQWESCYNEPAPAVKPKTKRKKK